MSLPQPAEDQIEERRSKVWELRVKKGLSIREIGTTLGVPKSTVFDDLEAVRVEVADETKESALRYREIELGRLDDLYARGVERLDAMKNGLDGGDPEAIAPILNSLKGISERRAKLLGLDGPVTFAGSIDGEMSPEAIRLAIAAEFGSHATPRGNDEPDSSTEPPSSKDP